jgi:peroxiredoxin Q/BCP
MVELKPGDKAPDFSIIDQEGNKRALEEFRGRKLILYFYPKDKTPGCTAEACNLSEHFEVLQSKNVAVLGVSADDQLSHKKFSEKFRLPFPLLADVEKKMINAYGVWGEKKFMGRKFMGILRTTFLINEEGIIEHIVSKVKTKSHTNQILELWNL